jgi:hypothetical protein
MEYTRKELTEIPGHVMPQRSREAMVSTGQGQGHLCLYQSYRILCVNLCAMVSLNTTYLQHNIIVTAGVWREYSIFMFYMFTSVY